MAIDSINLIAYARLTHVLIRQGEGDTKADNPTSAKLIECMRRSVVHAGYYAVFHNATKIAGILGMPEDWKPKKKKDRSPHNKIWAYFGENGHSAIQMQGMSLKHLRHVADYKLDRDFSEDTEAFLESADKLLLDLFSLVR